ncbi:hypothetical protein GBAR_LOCUS18689 [Geodia barretti]|uniref:Uncharacterized protein n=1 Tax=Geodia barretti TaxID=519541 RepID=A0AA35SQ07_GEOBA|nr:hypothetical protein GBAR_LOCUS18689 [Geodia barretti]
MQRVTGLRAVLASSCISISSACGLTSTLTTLYPHMGRK